MQGTDLLTTSQVARILAVAPATVHNWAKKDKLPSIVLPGGHRRFRRSDIEAVLRGDAA